MTKKRSWLYWIATIILALALLSGGFAALIQHPENVKGMTHLGYPAYFGSIIGFWKILGGIALLVPGFGRLKEWAYAGIFFNMTGAFVSHLVTGDSTGHLIAPLFFAALTFISWATRPQERVIGTLFKNNYPVTVMATGEVQAS